jgi:UDP:flavonoid glycosyltransferase YjiC (YdhE family)
MKEPADTCLALAVKLRRDQVAANTMSPRRYKEFLEDYEERRELLASVKKELGL